MQRAYYQATGAQFLSDSSDAIVGSLAAHSHFAIDLKQRNAWLAIIQSLKSTVVDLPDAHVFLEFVIPRMGRRVDAVVLNGGCIFVLEYKVGSEHFSSLDIDQVFGYALDLKNFHEPSHSLALFPILIATNAAPAAAQFVLAKDGVCEPVLSNGHDLSGLIQRATILGSNDLIVPAVWANGRYKPTPTIIEAAQALYKNHSVEDITRNEAGAENLSTTANYVSLVIDQSKRHRRKSICFVTGVPGSGKTLAGLNIANLRTKVSEDEHAVFLSGNGPLVKVLRAALIRDQKLQAKTEGVPVDRKTSAARTVEQFIQNIHHFRDANLGSDVPPIEKVVLFDEAQRAWNKKKTNQFMRQDRAVLDFDKSEPEFLLSVMDRHLDWCTVVCLVGNGQEINTGEAGLNAWLTALKESFPEWRVYMSDRIAREPENFGIAEMPDHVITHSQLHLSTSIRSFRSEHVSAFVSAIVDGKPAAAKAIYPHLGQFDFMITRDLAVAREWLRSRRRGTERAGLLAFSNAIRLKPQGIFVKATIEPEDWFLADRFDVRSCDYLEDIATEFDVQGLELDWACVGIDANLRITEDNKIVPAAFRGTRWQAVNDPDRRRYIINAHRVLLTRARQGVIVFVPHGDGRDPTRDPVWYDNIYRYLVNCGVMPVSD